MQRKAIAVYTAITGTYDSLRPPPADWRARAECIAYLDRAAPDIGWTLRPTCDRFVDPNRNAKWHKVTPEDLFEEYEYSIWVDGAVLIKSPLNPLYLAESLLGDADVAAFRHRTRGCIFDEAEACIAAKKDQEPIIRAQMAHYRKQAFPPRRGLNECTVLIRRHTAQLVQFCRAWHTEIVRFSRRDQLSFNVVAHRMGVSVASIPGTILQNEHFLWLYHDAGIGLATPVI